MKYKSVAEANLVIDSYGLIEDINPKSWYYTYKKESTTVIQILSVADRLQKANININDTITLLCILLFMTKNNSYNKIPDRLITKHIQISRATVRDMFYILANTQIMDIKWIRGELQYKLNLNLLNSDEFMLLKKNKIFFRHDDIRRSVGVKHNTFYYSPYSNQTVHKIQREVFFGMTLAYNKIDLETLKNKEGRTDITYAEIPVKLLCPMLNMTESQLMRKAKMYTKQTPYIKKHDKIYVDGEIKHYYNGNYKECDLANYQSGDYTGRTEVTDYSFIIFNDELLKSNISKRLIKNAKYYRDTVKCDSDNLISSNKTIYSIESDSCSITNFKQDTIMKECALLESTRYSSEIEDIFYEHDNNDITEDLNSIFDEGSYKVLDKGKLNQRTTDKFNLRRRINIPDVIKLSKQQIIKFIKLIEDRFIKYDNVDETDFKYYINKYKALEDRLSTLN